MKCTRNEDCSITEVCVEGGCHHPCDVHNPCAQNAICVNTNHGTDCSCAEGYQGNGYVGCQPGKNASQCDFADGNLPSSKTFNCTSTAHIQLVKSYI